MLPRRSPARRHARARAASSRRSARRCTSRRSRRSAPTALVVSGLRALFLRIGRAVRRPRGRPRHAGGRASSGARCCSTSGITLGLAVLIAGEIPAWGARLAGARGRASSRCTSSSDRFCFAPRCPSWVRSARRRRACRRLEPRAVDPRVRRGRIDHPARATPGGVSVALDALMRERGGVWIAHGAGHRRSGRRRRAQLDRGAARCAGVPAAPSLAVAARKRKATTPASATAALWPLCHQAHVRPQFKAERLGDVSGRQPPVRRRGGDRSAAGLVGVSQRLPPGARRQLPAGAAAAACARRSSGTFPGRTSIACGCARGARTSSRACCTTISSRFSCRAISATFSRPSQQELGVSVSGEVVYFGDRPVRVVSIPIGADFDRITGILTTEELAETMRRLARELGLEGKIVGDRRRPARLHQGHPRAHAPRSNGCWRAGPSSPIASCSCRSACPSREEVPGYAEISAEIENQIARVNERYGHGAGRRTDPVPEAVVSAARTGGALPARATSASSRRCTTG